MPAWSTTLALRCGTERGNLLGAVGCWKTHQARGQQRAEAGERSAVVERRLSLISFTNGKVGQETNISTSMCLYQHLTASMSL